MIFSGIHDRQYIQIKSSEWTHLGTKIKPFQLRLETSMSLQPRSHPMEFELEP
jgi:hypothetical protein